MLSEEVKNVTNELYKEIRGRFKSTAAFALATGWTYGKARGIMSGAKISASDAITICSALGVDSYIRFKKLFEEE